MALKSGKEQVLILVKALPHVGDGHGETVCCAGVTMERQWRRQFPVPFRFLEDQKFSRWQWIEYDWREPKNDPRPESQRVQQGTIRPCDKMPKKEQASFLQPLICGSTSEAGEQGHTLTLIRPIEPRFSYKKKDDKQIEKERIAYADATNQLSFLTQQQEPLDPCPYEFQFDYQSEAGTHTHKCGDWETTAMFYNFSKNYGEKEALRIMDQTFNEDYPQKGMAFAMGTHSKYPIWLLVGVLRLDNFDQMALL